MLTLHHVARCHRHIVAEIVETELIIGTECDITLIGCTTLRGVRLVLVDAVDSRAMEHIQRTHPFRVTFGQVIVDSDNMNATAGK